MKQKPYNDNLVMASIENLYEQASHMVHTSTTGLQRHNPNNLPIIGSLPVQISGEKETSELDDIVLTGRLHAAFADENINNLAAELGLDEGKGNNPFLAIRQAVIAAGDDSNQKLEQPEPSVEPKIDPDTARINAPDPMLHNKLPEQLSEQTFAKHLANLIDSEIERRMADRMQTIKKRAKKKKSTRQTSPKKRQ